MTQISSYVFFDIETTGLPWQERNRTKIIELSFVSVLRADIESTPFGGMPPVKKLTFLLNPQRKVHPKVTEITGLTNGILRKAPTFERKINSVVLFLKDLLKPVCLVAHNGNIFDFKILLAECNDVGVSLPDDILCIDSLVGFRKLLKGTSITYHSLVTPVPIIENSDILTDDEDDNIWPDFNISAEEWQEIDDLCLSFSDISCEENSDIEKNDIKSHSKKDYTDRVMNIVFNSKSRNGKNSCVRSRSKNSKARVCQGEPSKSEIGKQCFQLSALYKRLLNKEEPNAHRAEVDCLMLLECVVALKVDFLPWADSACKNLCDINPLIRY